MQLGSCALKLFHAMLEEVAPQLRLAGPDVKRSVRLPANYKNQPVDYPSQCEGCC